MEMRDCPKFYNCSANICILDADWQKRGHIPDEPTCFYLREAFKDGAEARFAEYGVAELYALARSLAEPMFVKHPSLRRRVNESSKSSSCLGMEKRLRGAVGCAGGDDVELEG